MLNLIKGMIIAGLIVFVQAASAQESKDYSAKKLSDHIYELSYDAGGYIVKVVASVGDEGILLVDTGHEQNAEALKAKLQEMWQGTPQIIILTHEHIEHIGGNEIFGKSPVVIGHSSLRTTLARGHFLFDEFTDATYPDIVFHDSLSLYFNGEEIRLISLAGGHSGSDIIVWFTKSNIACVGALCNWPHYPSIDEATGNVNLYLDDVQKVIDLLPKDIKIIPGHGEDCSMAELNKFHDMLVQTRSIVKNELANGKSVEILKKENVLKDFKGYEGGYTSTDMWIDYLANGFKTSPAAAKKSLYDPMYYALRDKGIDSAIAEYKMLKQNHADEYEFEETTPAVIGYILFGKEKYPEAIRFFELSLKEYPKGVYAGVSYQYLGKSFEKTGDIKKAIKNYKNLLKLDPQDSVTAKTIKDLEKK